MAAFATQTMARIQELGYIYDGGVEYQIKIAEYDGGAVQNTIVALVTGKKIALIDYIINSTVAGVAIKFGNSVLLTDISGTFYHSVRVLHQMPPGMVIKTATSNGLLVTSTSATYKMRVWYAEVN